jgi:hypothetical protein
VNAVVVDELCENMRHLRLNLQNMWNLFILESPFFWDLGRGGGAQRHWAIAA